MVLAQFGERIRIAGVDVAKKFLGLTLKLLRVRANGQAADGHDEPPLSPWSAGVGQGGSAITSERLAIYSGGLSPVRGREAPCTPGLNLPPKPQLPQPRDACQRNWIPEESKWPAMRSDVGHASRLRAFALQRPGRSVVANCEEQLNEWEPEALTNYRIIDYDASGRSQGVGALTRVARLAGRYDAQQRREHLPRFR